MPKSIVNGMNLYWRLSGSEAADALVLVHGSWVDHRSWDPIVPLLARSFRVLTYDRRGHSQSERPTTQGSVHEDVADLAALIEHLGLAPAHVLGNSFGGVIVLRLATERPELFRTLLVHEPPLFGILRDPATQSLVRPAQEQTRSVCDLLEKGEVEAGTRLFMEAIAFGPGAWAQFPTELRDICVSNASTFLDEERDPESRSIDPRKLTGFSRPALVTLGGQSPPFFPVVVETLAGLLPNAQKQTFPGAGHVPQLSDPDEYATAIKTFIETVRPHG